MHSSQLPSSAIEDQTSIATNVIETINIFLSVKVDLNIKIMILSLLPIQDLFVFSKVSKSTHALFNHPQLWRKRFQQDFPWAPTTLAPSRENYQYLYQSLREECRVIAAHVWAHDYLDDCGTYYDVFYEGGKETITPKVVELQTRLHSIFIHASKSKYIEEVNAEIDVFNFPSTEELEQLDRDFKYRARALSALSPTISGIIKSFNLQTEYQGAEELITRYISCDCHTLLRKFISCLNDGIKNYIFSPRLSFGIDCLRISIEDRAVSSIRVLMDAGLITPELLASSSPLAPYSPLDDAISHLIGLRSHYSQINARKEIAEYSEIIDCLLQAGSDVDANLPHIGTSIRENTKQKIISLNEYISTIPFLAKSMIADMQSIMQILQEKIIDAKPLEHKQQLQSRHSSNQLL